MWTQGEHDETPQGRYVRVFTGFFFASPPGLCIPVLKIWTCPTLFRLKVSSDFFMLI